MKHSVGVRELKTHLSHYLRQVKSGEDVVITERGKEVARIVPMGVSVEERLQRMVESGFAQWNGKKLPAQPPAIVQNRSQKTVAEVVIEDRE